MTKSNLSWRDERGSAAIIFSIVLAGAITAGVYFEMDKIQKLGTEISARLSTDRTQQASVSGLSQIMALMNYQPNPATGKAMASYAAGLPYVFPEPYLANVSVDRTRAVSGANTWGISSYMAGGQAFQKVSFKFADSTALSAKDVGTFADNGVRPTFTKQTVVTFNQPLFEKPGYPYWITSYNVSVASTASNNVAVRMNATLPVPKMPLPECRIELVGGKTVYLSNERVDMILHVSGVALEAYTPNDAIASIYNDRQTYVNIAPGSGNYTKTLLLAKSRSVTDIDKNVLSFSVVTPRPLAAVDGNATVSFPIYAYVKPADDQDFSLTKCRAEVKIAAATECHLYTDKASVAPGACANISYDFLGSVDARKLKIKAEDITGADMSSHIEKSGSAYKFCAPLDAYSGGAVSDSISAELARKFNKAIADLDSIKVGTLINAFSTHIELMKDSFPLDTDKALWSLTIDQCDELFYLTSAQRENLATLDLTDLPGLHELTREQVERIQALNPDKLDNLSLDVDLSATEDLDTVDSDALRDMNDFEPNRFKSHLNAALQVMNIPMDYKITGTIKDSHGGTNECITRVTRGTNQCPFFGNQFKTYTQSANWYINYYGNAWNSTVTMGAAFPNVEIASIASSPYQTGECPPDARCFAVPTQGGRTPMGQIRPANLATCRLTMYSRINLGCFEFHTKIRMGDGTDRKVADIVQGDMVMNPIRNVPMRVKRTTIGPEKYELVVVRAGDATVKVTTQHPMLTPTGVKAALYLTNADSIQDAKGTWRRIDSVSRERGRLPVVNLELDAPTSDADDHALLANGLITGDLYLQEKLGSLLSNQ